MPSDVKSSLSWKRCGVCKRDLGFDKPYYVCSVSTCTSGRNHPIFCSVDCFNQHVPVLRHRDAWAEQKRSPTRSQWEAEQALFPDNPRPKPDPDAAPAAPPPRRIIVEKKVELTPSQVQAQAEAEAARALEAEVLVVASKLKAYVKAKSGMNTSESVLEKLSEIIRDHTDRAIEHARFAGRRTVMDRDFTGR